MEFIIIYWPPDLRNRMKSFYNDSTNGFATNTVFYQFKSEFEVKTPIEGEVIFA